MSEAWSQDPLLWKFKTNDRVYSSACISGDLLFIGSGDQNCYAINKKTGEKVWVFQTEGIVHSTPVVVNDLLIVVSGDGNLYALNKDSGMLVWTFSTEGEKSYGLWDYYLSSPVSDGALIFFGSGDGHVYAVTKKEGKLEWKYNTGDIVHASAVLDSTNVYIGGFNGTFYSFEKESGTLNWSFKTVGAQYFPKGEIQKAALYENGILYFGSRDYNIYALDASTGRGVWNMKQSSGWIIATPIAYDEHIYFGTSDAHIFYCMDKEKGIPLWKHPVNMRVYGSAVAHKEHIYFGTFDGKILGVHHENGRQEWSYQLEISKQSYSSIYKNDSTFNDDFVLYGSDYKKSEARIHSLGSILSDLIIDDGILYFGSSDGYVYAVKLP